jgi:hypothetical protein
MQTISPSAAYPPPRSLTPWSAHGIVQVESPRAVITDFGTGCIVTTRDDGFSVVRLPFGTAFLRDDVIAGTAANVARVQKQQRDMRQRAVSTSLLMTCIATQVCVVCQ